MFSGGRPLTGKGVVAKKGAAVVPKENAFPCLVACVVDCVGVGASVDVGVVGVVEVVALSGDSVTAVVEKSLNVNLDTNGDGVGDNAGAGVGF